MPDSSVQDGGEPEPHLHHYLRSSFEAAFVSDQKQEHAGPHQRGAYLSTPTRAGDPNREPVCLHPEALYMGRAAAPGGPDDVRCLPVVQLPFASLHQQSSGLQ